MSPLPTSDLDPNRHVLRVELGVRGYDIHVGPGLVDAAGPLVTEALPGRRLFVVADEAVLDLHGDRLGASLAAHARVAGPVMVPSGEASKSWDGLARVAEALIALGIDRRGVVVAFGGGVVGDLAGFAAAVVLRGVDFVQIPTTLLAQVDSSVGGKTGINVEAGKNLVGAFHQPRLVLADTAVLDTLPARELRAGYAEVVKYGALGDAAFFDWLEPNGPALLAGDGPARTGAIARSCAAKAETVADDEREQGRRALLNLGHTFGHALEAELGYDGRLLHGEAVAVGMVLAFDLSVALGLCPPADRDRLAAHLGRVGLPASMDDLPAHGWDPDRLLGHMAHDKKVLDGRLTFVLAHGIGAAFVARDVDAAAVRAVLAAAIGPRADAG